MSMAVLAMHPLRPQYPRCEPDLGLADKISNSYGIADGWPQSPRGNHSSLTAEYLGFPTNQLNQLSEIPIPSIRSSDSQFIIGSNFDYSTSQGYDVRNRSAPRRSFNDFDTSHDPNATIGPLGVSTAAMYSSPAMFTASNAHPNASTICPMDTRFELDHASPTPDSRMSFDSNMHNAGSSNFEVSTQDADFSSFKRRCDSLQSTFDTHQPAMGQSQVGRRRGSEYAEPGSARAIYLEKNRKAASKCRSKQKRQQDELIATARDVERRNKILKAEVEMLKGGVRDLMELVGQHTDCPDARLKLYVQREADRLAAGSQRNELPSPLSRSSGSIADSGDKGTTPEER